ncbi:hypothetical protein NQ176_g49 [Zarea fungicola]|uniref:Uncharacterized protein n=1 Tax=Zarea fungicola TaxID=93591 RepID=A0ACC1NZU9_9HYPO|nr:hypothetical protein NQ176_g49 [Lecanicillium fungicola]
MMTLRSAIILSFLATVGLSTPVDLGSNIHLPRDNSTIVKCHVGTTDPICAMIRQPSQDILTEITYPNGTVVTIKNKYTREQLHAIRTKNNVTSVEHHPGKELKDRTAEFISGLEKRESKPPLCFSERQTWYDQHDWNYWYQTWKQIGSCFYCDDCTKAIAVSFAVAETWTYGLTVDFSSIIKANFGFSWGQTNTLTDTQTCVWKNVEHGCHSIWYQPLMSAHNGYANYQTHTHCYFAPGSPASDSYYDHNYAFANVNQAISSNSGVSQGNMGCNSGCQGNDHRQCQYGNGGGSLWPYPN